MDQIKLAPPISRPSKIICIGLNYLDHIRESKGTVPEIPIIFAKFPNSIIGHEERIEWDSDLTKKVDFEAELAVIIGKKARYLDVENAYDHIYGYTCANDVSARDLQFGDKQWVRGKTLDTFCPIGPWIVTADEIPDPNNLEIKSRVNNQIMQDSNTDLMLFKIPELLVFLSSNFTLEPGDIILTGTPHGVGTFREPSMYLKDGDRVEVEIERIGRLLNTCSVK
jgi:2-keto-4-pentenoate hydratase/2-oxohepta-3-ene-1,7-dioic acid hydratase in catechol pathway